MSQVVPFLREHGPTPLQDLPASPNTSDRQNAVGILRWRLGGRGSTTCKSPPSNTAFIAYLRDEHAPESVIEAWIDANRDVIEMNEYEAVYKSLSRKANRGWMDPLRGVWESRGWPKSAPREESYGGASPGTCPLCGEDYNHSFPQHRRRECDA